MNKRFFNLFSFCKVIKGKDNAIICDFQKENIEFIPVEMVDVIYDLEKHSVEDLEKKYIQDIEIFKSYIEFLEKEGFGIVHKERLKFKEISLEFSTPEYINNAIIEYGFSNYNLLKIVNELDELLNKFIELRLSSFNIDNLEELIKILSFLENSVCRGITIMFPYTPHTNIILEQVSKFNIVRCVYFYGYKKNKIILKNHKEVFFVTENLSEINKAIPNHNYIVNNIEYFIEAQNYNPYYNKKIAINMYGDIKNCIKNKSIFGNVLTHSIKDIIFSSQFQEFWYATHDKILGIKDSELRYNMIVCNDLEKKDNGYFKAI